MDSVMLCSSQSLYAPMSSTTKLRALKLKQESDLVDVPVAAIRHLVPRFEPPTGGKFRVNGAWQEPRILQDSSVSLFKCSFSSCP